MSTQWKLFIVAFLVCYPVAAMSQDTNSIRLQIQNTVKAKLPNVKLLRTHQKDPKEVVYVWANEEPADPDKTGDNLIVHVFNAGSNQEAAERMRKAIDHLAGGPGHKRTDIGDEAYFSNELSNSAVLRFRKANVYIELTGSSKNVEELAVSLAKLISGRNARN